MDVEQAGGDAEQAQALVDVLRSVLHPEHVWHEELNARWVVFVRHEEQTYCLLPLHYQQQLSGGTERGWEVSR